MERSWRWCRRRPVPAALGAALILTAILGFIVILVMWRRAEGHRVTAERNARHAVEEGHRAAIESARRALELGVENCEKGEIGRGLLWMARALKLAPGDALELRWAIRAKLAHWRLGLAHLSRLIESPREVNTLGFSPDGARIAASMGLYYAVQPCPVRFWDPETGEPVGSPLIHKGSSYSVEFGRDARRVWTSSCDGSIGLWDVAKGGLVRWLAGSVPEITLIRLRPDGRALAVAVGKRLKLVDSETGESIAKWPLEFRGDIMNLDWSPDGGLLAAATKAGTVGLCQWDGDEGRLVTEIQVEKGYVSFARFSPDSKFLLAGGTDAMTHLYDVATARQISTPTTQHREVVNLGVFHPGGLSLCVGSTDGEARLVDLATGEPLAQPLPHGNLVSGIAFHPSGRSVATGSWDRGIRIWNLPLGYTPSPPASSRLVGAAATYAPDGRSLLTVRGTTVRRVTEDGRPDGPEATHGQPISWILGQPNGGPIFATIGRNTVRLWHAATITSMPGSVPIIHPDNGPHQGIYNAAFHPDGRTFFTAGSDCEIRRWDARTGQSLGVLVKTEDIPLALAISPNGRAVLTGDWRGQVRLWDASTGKAIGPEVQHGSKVTSAAFDPGGRHFVTGSVDGTAQVWDAVDGRRVGPTLNHRKSLAHVIFDPTGRMIATSSLDRTSRLWDLATGTPIGPPIRHPDGAVRSLQFRPDG